MSMGGIRGLGGAVAAVKAVVDAIATNVTSLVTNMTTVLARIPSSGRAINDGVWTDAKAALLDAAISTRAASSPLLLAPMASGLVATAATGSGMTYTSSLAGYGVLLYSAANATSYQTVLSVSGSGVLNFVSFGAGNSPPTLKITIDGVVAYETAGFTSGQDYQVVGSVIQSGGTALGVSLEHIPFKTSLLIEVKAAAAIGTAYVRYKYWRAS